MLDVGSCHTLGSISGVLCYCHSCLWKWSDEDIGVYIPFLPELKGTYIVMSVGWSKSIEGKIMFMHEEHPYTMITFYSLVIMLYELSMCS
jgi:hypothetical protein